MSKNIKFYKINKLILKIKLIKKILFIKNLKKINKGNKMTIKKKKIIKLVAFYDMYCKTADPLPNADICTAHQ
jgi:hypothetical protein